MNIGGINFSSLMPVTFASASLPVAAGTLLLPRWAEAAPRVVSRLWENAGPDRMINAMEWADRVAPWLVAGGLLAAGGFALSRLLPKFGSEWRGGEETAVAVTPQPSVNPVSTPPNASNGSGVGLQIPMVATPTEKQGLALSDGTLIPGYTLDSLLGRGGEGAVYKARKHDLFDWFAVKVIHPEKAEDRVARGRFEREIKTLLQLDHPNIVRVRAVGEAGGHLYMVLEYMRNGNLHEWFVQNRYWAGEDFSDWVSTVLKLVLPCVDGLAAMHRLGVVHRDIKPANIFLDATGIPKLGDLGLARTVKPGGTFTNAIDMVGTIPYMPVERFEEGKRRPDPREDIYSMGVTLYELLTGGLPYENSIVAYLKKRDEPIPDPRDKDSRIPKALAEIVMKAIARNPEDRYETAERFREALRAFLERREDAYEATVLDSRKPSLILATADWIPMLGSKS